MKYRADIDGLRALAVIPVLLYHAGVPGFGGGFVGVDIFFVISGYLICGMIDADIRNGNVLARQFLQAPDAAHPAGAVRHVPGHQRPRLSLFPAGRTAGLFQEPRQRDRLGLEHLFRAAPPAISTRRPKPSRCCIRGRSAWRSSSTSSFPC